MIFKSIIEGFLRNGFKTDVQVLAKPIVISSIAIFSEISKQLRPTPNKSHYTFNLRDISKVFQGILMAKSSSINRPEKMVRLWIHETCRVYHDRLINMQDRSWVTQEIIDLLKTCFRINWEH